MRIIYNYKKILISIVFFGLLSYFMLSIETNSLINEQFVNNHFNGAGNIFNSNRSLNNSDLSNGFWTNNLFK